MAASLSTLSVVVADDHEPTRIVVRNMLDAAGVGDVRLCGDGHEALALLRERSARLVITDHMMPGMDGIALISALRADPAHAAVRTLLLTGYGDADAKARAAGANAVLMKPVEADALLRAVENALS